MFLLEGLSYTQENPWTLVCTHETVRGAGFQANCLWPASIQTSGLQNITAFDMLVHIEYRRTQDAEDRPQFFKE